MFLSKNHHEDDKVRISPSKSVPNFENALFLSAHHKFVLALILMKIWDFSYFSSTKTMGIPPTFSFDTTTTSDIPQSFYKHTFARSNKNQALGRDKNPTCSASLLTTNKRKAHRQKKTKGE